MDVEIRVARETDLSALVEIHNQAIKDQKTAELDLHTLESRQGWLHDHQVARHPILVAEKADQILGYVTLSPYRSGRRALQHTAEVSYFVHRDHRSRGVASSLLEQAFTHCLEHETSTLLAILLENNLESIGLLEKYGFHSWGHLPQVANFNGREVGQYIYGKRLEKR